MPTHTRVRFVCVCVCVVCVYVNLCKLSGSKHPDKKIRDGSNGVGVETKIKWNKHLPKSLPLIVRTKDTSTLTTTTNTTSTARDGPSLSKDTRIIIIFGGRQKTKTRDFTKRFNRKQYSVLIITLTLCF